ncbi:hypothetical protein GCM10009634_25990 [Saccharothrix xinjiangensis]
MSRGIARAPEVVTPQPVRAGDDDPDVDPRPPPAPRAGRDRVAARDPRHRPAGARPVRWSAPEGHVNAAVRLGRAAAPSRALLPSYGSHMAPTSKDVVVRTTATFVA